MKKFTLIFALSLMNLMAIGQIVPPYSNININNVDMRITGIGSNFILSIDDNLQQSNACIKHEVPVGSGCSTIFQNAIWIGGMDSNDSLHFAGFRFQQVGDDYWSGPLRLADASTDLMTVLKHHHVWNVTREEIEQFRQHYADANYQIPADILSWPAHGDEGFAENLAPFVDVNGDGRYNPADGDYPDIRGDQCLYYIYNDTFNTHTESGGKKIGIEIHGMAYAYSAPENDALNNTIFFNYKFFNRSSENYHDVFVGIFDDFDIGYGWDDFVGCDVQRGAFFGYNGDDDDTDPQGEHQGYGSNWPVQVCTVLAGPYMDADGRDNPDYDGDCNTLFNDSYPLDKYAYNGLNFGNGIVDDERLGLCHFCYFGSSPVPNVDPSNDVQSYLSMSMPFPYHNNIGPDCMFAFPGDSDPCNFGTNGIQPNGGYNQNGLYWTEEEQGDTPSDRRAFGSVGPFTLNAGAVQELDFAYTTVFSNETQTQMQRKGAFIDQIRDFFKSNFTK